MAETTPNYGNADSYSAEASATIKARNCLEVSGARTVAPTTGPGGAFAGVAAYDVPKGELVTVRTTGVHTLRCTGDIAAGARVTTAPGGAVTVGEPAIGIAQSPSVGGAVRVKLIAPGGGSAGGGGGAAWTDVHAATEKPVVVDADDFAVMDSASSWGLKRITWANLKAAALAYISSAVATFTNKTLTTPTINGGTVTGATINNAASAVKAGTTLEVIGSPGANNFSLMTTVGSGVNDATAFDPYQRNSLAYFTLQGGVMTCTLNGAPVTPATPEQMFFQNTAPTTFTPSATTDRIVIELDLSAFRLARLGQPIIGVDSRPSVAARDITVEVFDGTTWTTAGSVTNHPLGIWAVRSSVMAVSKIRYTFTNFRFATNFSVTKLFACVPNNDSVEGFGGLLTRFGGVMTAPDGSTVSTLLKTAPTSLTAPGIRGQMAFSADGTKVYFCTATNVWRSAALSATLFREALAE